MADDERADDVVLRVEDLRAGYGEIEVLQGVNIDVRRDEIVTIIGPNGAGKSTLLKAIFGLLPPSAGRVVLEGAEVTGWSPRKLVDRGLAYVPQVDNVFPNLSIRENLEIGAFRREDSAELTAPFEAVHRLFPALAERPREKVGRLSGGQRQMVAMGRALMSDPKLLLLDEPSAGLAPNLVRGVFENVQTIAASGVPILLVEQNARTALSVSHRGYVLDQGLNRHEGPGPELLQDEHLGKLYLGG